jgi:hypothetical protein
MQPKNLPIAYMGGLIIELELVNDQLEPIISQGPNNEDVANTALNFVVQNDNAALINTSTEWELQNVELKCDLVTLDSALENSMAQHLLNGGTFPINYSTFVSQQQVLTNMISSVNINRSASRLKTVFISFFKSQGDNTKHILKDTNLFFHPMNTSGDTYDNKKEISMQLQIGSKLFPERAAESLSEQFYQLKKAMGVSSSPLHSWDISALEYQRSSFIYAIDTEKILQASFTGLNTRAGDLMTLKMKWSNGGPDQADVAASTPDRVYLTLQTDNILEISSGQATVFD